MLLLLSVGNVLTGGFQLSAQEQSKRFSVKVDNITGFNNIYRGTWSNFVWPWYTPLTNRMELIQLNDKYVKKLYNFFDQFSKLKFYSARGDSNGVAHFLDNLISKKFDY